jgi:intein-encoded DNA endonuclease-like protein
MDIKPEYANYITGFVDGEGSFNVSFKIRKDYRQKVKITPSFNISQKEREILIWIQSILNCGTIRMRKDGVCYYEVTDIKSLNNIIVPFFKKHSLKTKKKHSFEIFSKIVSMMSKKEHLTREGILEIYDLRELVLVGRKRKYSRSDIEEFFV